MRIKLSDAFVLQMGKTPSRNNSAYWGGNHKWISIADLGLGTKIISDTKEGITDAGVDESGIRIVPKGTVVMSFKLSIGKTAITAEDMFTNEAIMAFIDKQQYPIDTGYLYHFCCGTDWTQGTNKAVMGLTLNKATISDKEIDLPDLGTQHKIAQLLDHVDYLIARRREELKELEQLVKSRFIELFGDPVINPKMFEFVQLERLADIVAGITKGRKTNDERLYKVPYMAVSNVKAGYIDWSTVKTIDATLSEIEQYRLKPYDVLMTEGGDPDKLGRGAVITEPPENCIHQNHVFRVRVNTGLILPQYLEEYLQHQKAKQYFLGCAKQTTGIASINMKQLRALPVLLPDMALQTQFAAFVQQTDKSKLSSLLSCQHYRQLARKYRQEWMICQTSNF